MVIGPSLEPVGDFELPPIDDCNKLSAKRVRSVPTVDEDHTIVVQTEPRRSIRQSPPQLSTSLRQSNRERRHNGRYHPSQYVLSSTTQTDNTHHNRNPYGVPLMLLCSFIGAAVHEAGAVEREGGTDDHKQDEGEGG